MTQEIEIFGAKVCVENYIDGQLIKIYTQSKEYDEKINVQIMAYLYKEGFIDRDGLYQAMNNLRKP